MSIDYRGVEALYTVQELQSFEKAASRLHLTQSAISQRIKALEMRYGEPVLIRGTPIRPTKLGETLIAHFKQITLLEEDLHRALDLETNRFSFSIAINRDSLETWFLSLMDEKKLFGEMTLEIIADDQELTIEYLKKGVVSACLSTSEKEIVGGKCDFVGEMEYVLAASPAFAKKYFSKGSAKECLQKAPAIKFDQNDWLHERYLEKYFHFGGEKISFHVIPSVRGFKKFALMSYGYGLIPRIDIEKELKQKKLVQLYPGKTWKIPLYWHSWQVQSKFYQRINYEMISHVKKKLIL